MSSGNGSGSGSGNGANRRRQIKGGGRAVMSRESQTAVIDLLMRMRNSSASEIEIETETETDFSDKPETLSLSLSLSAHERKRREAKFVKRLVREHEQKQWRTKLRSGGNSNINGNGNGNPNQATTAAAKPTENTTTTVTTTTTTAKKKTTTALPKTTTNANEKVRIELVEAIFKDGPSKKDSKKDNSKKKNSKSSVDNNGKKSSTTSSSSSSNSKSSNSNANKYKDGAKKVVVLPRSTTPAEILAKIAPAKLRLKTKPVRLFLKASSWSSSSSKTLLVELTDEADDLSGLDDGTTLYVTTTPAPGTTTTPAGGGDEATKKGGGADKSNNDNDNNNHNHNNNNNNHNDNQSADVESPIEAVADPLDSVKRAYHRQRDYRREMRKRERTQSGNNHISNKNNNNNKNNKNNNGNNNNNNNNKSRWCSAAAPNTNAGASRHAATRASLPAAAYREQILSAVENNRVVVLCGATGCGKSTQVPQFLIEGTGTPNDGSPQPTKTKTTTTTTTRRKYVVVTQPRRVAATSLANRVAEEQGSPPPGAPGSTVGYMVRLDRNIDETSCRIVYMTVGILLRMLVSESSVGAPASTSTSTGGDAKDSSSLSLSSSSSSDSSQPLPLTIENISHVVIDEVHERDANTDFVLTLLKGLLFSPSPSPLSHLKLILMSATASSDLFVRYFTPPRITVTANANANATATATATANPPVVLEIPGRTFPVDVRWLPECERFAGKRLMRSTSTSTTAPGRGEETETSSGGNANSSLPKLSPRATDAIDNDFIRALIVKIVQQQQSDGELDAKPDNSNSNSNSNDTTRAFRSTGAILVFLPGQGEIESLAARLTDRNNTNSTCIVANQDICTVLKLHSSVSRSEQDKVFRRARIGTVKIVLATNIAETSLTIPDVSHVIDACLVKESRYNAAKRTPELVTVWTSKASLKQRAGRAGRTSAGTCWRLCSETFCNEELLPQTAPEMLRIPLDELVLQIGLLYEQRRDDYHSRILHLLQTSSQKGGSACTITVTGAARRTAFPPGAQPIKFLSMTPAPPPRTSLVQACKHLLEVGALHVVDDGGSNSNSNSNSEEMDTWYYRLTPLGYHLSRLPMDARVGKVLIVGCILGCLDGALTIAAALSCTKSCFYPRPTKEHIHAREILVQNGFGGAGWPGGTAKGDLIAVVATYRAWTETKKESQKWKFCKHHALDYATLRDMDRLRNQFGGLLADAGFAARPQNNRDSNRNNNKSNDDGSDDWCHKASDDALLTSCCLVAGLYPNICSLIRPRKGGPRGGRRGGRLYTNDGDECIPQSNSFQCKRVREAAQTGKDAYAVYHAKHRTLGTTAAANHKKGASEIFLTEVNFVSRFALLLFGGDLEIVQNAIVVDGWLKFKVSSDNNSDGDKDNDTRTPKADTVNNAVLILALREQLDQMILERVVSESSAGRDPEGTRRTKERHESIIQVVRKLLSEEG